jgi:hypothetical protein
MAKKRDPRNPVTSKRDPGANWSLTAKSISEMSRKADAQRKMLYSGLSRQDKTQAITQEQLIGYWVRGKGLKHKDLVAHPHIDDLVLLVNIRDVYWDKFNRSEQAHWGAVWNTVYHKQRPLKQKALTRFERDCENSHQRHLQKIIKQAEQRRKIQEARQNPKPTQRDDDMMAKASLSDMSVPWDV